MKSTLILGIAGSATVIVALFEMMRRHRLREKYAVLWFMVALGVLALAIFPGLLTGVADIAGVEVPVNLLFFLASLVLLMLTLQHSYELGRLEEKTRVLAEEIALLRLDLERRTVEPERRPRPDVEPPSNP
ncbi:DUF2304 domain-containing protein [Nocardioides sp. R-C-SC26]|uniref:DUF2304 domain-containing protein n=1 Tax=Nocardioides sp. R-C-SC26 TaxID=2870414 RepID=UPI001E64557E|nr:DUF2304 domain-containing protein [Nocardioides sp. R-C-SC26]